MPHPYLMYPLFVVIALFALFVFSAKVFPDTLFAEVAGYIFGFLFNVFFYYAIIYGILSLLIFFHLSSLTKSIISVLIPLVVFFALYLFEPKGNNLVNINGLTLWNMPAYAVGIAIGEEDIPLLDELLSKQQHEKSQQIKNKDDISNTLP